MQDLTNMAAIFQIFLPVEQETSHVHGFRISSVHALRKRLTSFLKDVPVIVKKLCEGRSAAGCQKRSISLELEVCPGSNYL